MAIAQRLTSGGILQTPGIFDEYTRSGGIPYVYSGDAIAVYPSTTSGTGMTYSGTPGTFTWTAPVGVTKVSVVCVGGGGGGGGNGAGGGGGGALAYINNYTVIPGNVYTVVAGLGGLGYAGNGTAGANGATSYFVSTGTVGAGGGVGGGAATAGGTGGAGGTVIAGTGFAGGAGGNASTYSSGGGGGGAGGYSAAGGAGGVGYSAGTITGSSSTGGGGGGGSGGGNASAGGTGGGGGGVGLLGAGSNGTGGAAQTTLINSRYPGTGGTGGSGGTDGGTGTGGSSNPIGPTSGVYGGGGGGGDGNNNTGGTGGVGAVRILWGYTSWPDTQLLSTGDLSTTDPFDEITLSTDRLSSGYSGQFNTIASSIVTYVATSGGNGSVLNAKSNNWTVEFWFKTSRYADTGGNGQYIIDLLSDSALAFLIYADTSGSNIGFYDGVNNQTGALTTPYTRNQWNHFALVCNTTLSLYINGAVQSGWNGVTNNIVSNGYTTNINQFRLSSAAVGVGVADWYFSQVRINNSTSVYTGNFTPPTRLSATQGSALNINAITSGTMLMTCNCPSFVDQSTNAFTLTPYTNTPPYTPAVTSDAPTYVPSQTYVPTLPSVLTRQSGSSYQVYNHIDEVSLAYTITPDKTIVNEGDTVTYTINSPPAAPVFTTIQTIMSYPSGITGGGTSSVTYSGTPGTFTWTAPAGVTKVSVVAVGGGGAGGQNGGGGGGGGALAYVNNFTVTPGNTYSVVTGAGGTLTGGVGNAGGASSFNTSTVIANGGGGGGTYGSPTGGAGGTVGAGTGFAGGAGGAGQGTNVGGGGGGAGGYTAAGGAGGTGNTSSATAGSASTGGGGGGGGGANSVATGGDGGPGGGVGLLGQTTNGSGGAVGVNGAGGGGGSRGSNGVAAVLSTSVGVAGIYGGGGGGGGGGGTGSQGQSPGAVGAVSITYQTSPLSISSFPTQLYWTNSGSIAAPDLTGGIVYGVTPLTWAGTATATLWSFTGITQLSTSGFGTGAVFSIRKNNTTTTMATYGVLTVIPTSPGSGYSIGDTITIDGASLGLTTTTNNLTITVGSDWFAQGVSPTTVTGTGLGTMTAGAATWTCPDGVYRVSVICIGGGGGGASGANPSGGGGGALAYIQDYAVTPNTTYAVQAGAAGTAAGAGGTSSFVSTSICAAGGGSAGTAGAGGGGAGGTVLAGTGFPGGAGGGSSTLGGGGGGAGGYTAAGGAGGSSSGASPNLVARSGANSTDGSGGGSTGGGAGAFNQDGTVNNSTTGNGGGGGGTGLLGISNSGIGGVNLAGTTGAVLGQSGLGGSGGATGGAASATVGGAGAAQGGGGGGGTTTGGVGGAGAVRIIWNHPTAFLPPTSALPVPTNTVLLTAQAATPVDATGINRVSDIFGPTPNTTTIPFASTYSYQFNGTTQYLSIPHSSNFVYGSGVDFTIEGWVYTSATTINKGAFYKRSGVGIFSGVNFGTSAGTASRFSILVANATGTAWTINDSTVTFVINTWYHFAITKTAGNVYLYINGTLRLTLAHTTAVYDDGSALTIGRDPGGAFWVGYLSNFRVVNGTALYTPTLYPSGFTPSTVPLTAVTNTKLLTLQSPGLFDNTGINNITSVPTLAGTTATLPFAANYAVSFNGTSQYLTVPINTALVFAGDFTVECWAYATTTTNTPDHVFNYGNYTFVLCHNDTTWIVDIGNGASSYFTLTGIASLNAWHHFAVTRSSTTYTFWIDGIAVATTIHFNAPAVTGNTLSIGRNQSGGQWFTGYISNFRIVKGTAVYTSTFIPTATSLTAIANTTLLTCQNATIIDNSGNNLTITNNGAATTINTAGPYTYSWLLNGTTQYAVIPHSSNFVFGTGVDFTIEGYLYTSATTINKGLYYKRSGSGVISSIAFGTSTTTVSRFTLKVANDTGSAWTISDETAGTFVINTWYHFAITKTNGVIYLYLNGVLTRQYAHTTAIYDDGSVLNIGRDPGGSFWVGNLSNIRVIKGTALYYPPTTTVSRNYPDYPPVTTNSGTINLNLTDLDVTAIYPSTTTGTSMVYSGTPGTFAWTCPPGISSVNVICVGGGGSGGNGGFGGSGGGGGGLGYRNNISVTPGVTYAVFAGTGGAQTIYGQGNAGGDSYFISTATVKGGGGGAGSQGLTYSSGGSGGTYTGTGGGNGGAGGAAVGSGSNDSGGGGGAGGYAGNGGAGAAGAYSSPTAGGNAATGSGGGGGGSNGIDVPYGYSYAGGGGGVGLSGKGSDGAGGSAIVGGYINSGNGGGGGSGGATGGIATGAIAPYGGPDGTGRGGAGGAYGGGGGGGVSGSGAGGVGAVRIYASMSSNTTISLPIAQDILQEGIQDLRLSLRSGSTSGNVLATAPTVVVADTSKPLALPGGGQCWCAYPNYVSGPNLVYTGTPGVFTFTAPKGYTTVSAVCIGAGGAGMVYAGGGGGGGALSYSASIAVTAGTSYTITCGAPGRVIDDPSLGFVYVNGSASSFSSTVIANGGTTATTTAGGAGGTVGAGTGFAGGAGGAGFNSYSAGGGGGAGGYTAVGGVGGTVTGSWPVLTAASGASSATGGAGGGGGGSTTAGAYFADGGGGGGTSPFGSVAVASIAGIAYAGLQASTGRGGGGSGGNPTTTAYGVQLGQNGYTATPYGTVPFQKPNGGQFGGGGGGGDGNNRTSGDGGVGCVRIIWGTGRAYPATLTADRVSGYPAAVGNPSGQQ